MATSDGAGAGATFAITLPLEAEAKSVQPETQIPEQSVAANRLRLLVVEDHVDTARTLGILLGRAGFVVTTAGDVQTALNLISSQPFDMLVSDLGLPDGTGYDLMRQVRATSSLPGIAMSGYGMEEDIRKSKEAGFSEQLVKPVTVNRLEQAIHKALGKQPG